MIETEEIVSLLTEVNTKLQTNKQSDMPKNQRNFDPFNACFCYRCGSYYEGFVFKIEKDDFKLRCPVCGARVDGYREGEE